MMTEWSVGDLAMGIAPGTKGKIGFVSAVSESLGVPVIAFTGESWCYWADSFLRIKPLTPDQHFVAVKEIAEDLRRAKK